VDALPAHFDRYRAAVEAGRGNRARAGVVAAYGFSPTGDLLAQLLDLNLTVARRIESGQSATAPGIPPSVQDPSQLISDDCVRP
jgi:hypothetical protein